MQMGTSQSPLPKVLAEEGRQSKGISTKNNNEGEQIIAQLSQL